MKILSIVETAFRGTLEEQDDAALWVNHALKNAGANIDLVLRGNAVNYAVKGQNPEGVRIGNLTIEHAPKLDQDLLKMKSAGISIHLIREDIEERGIPMDNLLTDFELIGRAQLPSMLANYDHVWHW